MQSSPDMFDQFFAPLVGDESRVSNLKEELASHVNTYTDDFDATDPYERLQTGVVDLVDSAGGSIQYRGIEAGEYRKSIRVNGKIAMKQTVAVVRTVGDIYKAQATTPQHIDGVQRNTDKALLRLYAIASLDGVNAATNLATYLYGRDPSNPISRYLAQVWLAVDVMRKRSHMKARTFAVSGNESGQLAITPRFRGTRLKQSSLKCPATERWVGPPGDQQTALWTLMHAIGDVAVTEIFPHYFSIVGDAETGGYTTSDQGQLEGKG